VAEGARLEIVYTLTAYQGFKSLALRHTYLIYWPLGQAVKTPPFHGGNTGSNPVGVTIWRISSAGRASALQAEGRRFDPVILHHKFYRRGVEQSGSSSGS
jgi:hypothetical protein